MAHFLIQCAVSFVATVAFAILYHVPRAQYVWCGITGMAGWACYLLYMAVSPSAPMASLLATAVLTVFSRAFAVRRRCPSTLFLICGIFPLVPGAGIYYTAYSFILGETAECVANGIETFKIAVAIALGIVVVMALPNGLFRLLEPRRSSRNP